MKTNEIQKNLRGDYVVRIQTINHGVIKDFVFYNLSEAINCEKMNENKDKNIVRYDVIVVLREDCFGYNCRFDTIKEISFDNLFDAIRYANHLTFSECEKMDSKANNDVPVYYVAILMKEDCFGNDCKIVIDGKETYPTIDYFCKVKPMF